MSNYRLDTNALHAGQDRKEAQNSRGIPVYRTTSYLFNDTEHAANLFGLRELGNIYTRLQNPTQDILEQRLAALEGGAAALALASGTSAIFYSIVNLAGKGEEIVASKNLYGGTYTMFNNILPDFGITVRFVDPKNLDEVAAAINKKTRAVYTETIGNPTLAISNIKALSELAHKNDLPLLVDATFTTPYLIRPIEHGADIVIHSLTKWLGGHGSAIGGVVVDAGKFNWGQPKFKNFNEPEASYHGIRFGHDLGDLTPLAFILRMRVVPLRNLGSAISPDNAWILLQGIETIHLRMQRHCENALAVAEFLKDHPKVEWVRYPGLKDDPEYEAAKSQFENGFGGMVVFGIKGGAKAGSTFINSLELLSHVANVGDAKSLAIHPASTTHSQLSEEQQKDGGITPELIRLSVGIEHIEDIKADIDQALNKS